MQIDPKWSAIATPCESQVCRTEQEDIVQEWLYNQEKPVRVGNNRRLRTPYCLQLLLELLFSYSVVKIFSPQEFNCSNRM